MNVKETLVAARELIADESGWTQQAWARTASGGALPSWDLNKRTDAVRYCAIGALRKVDGFNEQAAKYQLEKVTFRLFNLDPISVNDQLGHEAIIRAYDEAIAEAERSAQ